MNYYVSGENVNGRPCRGVVHVVKKGDTLYKISRVYDVKVADLIWMNPGVRIYNFPGSRDIGCNPSDLQIDL